MSLDPHIAGAMQLLAEAGAKPLHEGTPEEGRAFYLATTAGALTPEQVVPVARVRDTTVGAAGPLKAACTGPKATGRFRPWPTSTAADSSLATWTRTTTSAARSVAARWPWWWRWTRLAPEHAFPAGVEDAVAATKWIVAHAHELGGNHNVGVAGDSAGGNFSAVVAQRLRDEGIALTAQFLIYPAVDHVTAQYPSVVENGEGYLLDVATINWFYRHYAGAYLDPTDPRLPLRARI